MKRILLIAGLVFPGLLFAQSKILSMEEATLGTNLSAKSLSQLQWNGSDNSWFHVSGTYLLKSSPGKTAQDTILRLRELNAALKAAKRDSLSRMPQFTAGQTNMLSFTQKNRLFLFDLNTRMLTEANSWPADATNTDLSEKSLNMAFTRSNGLYVCSGGKERRVEVPAEKDVSCGASNVHRNEFGISKGTFWSPSGDRLAYYRMDESEVATYPLVDLADPIALAHPVKYPMAGQKSHTVKIHIYTLNDSTITELETGADPASYLTNVTWSPDGRLIYIAVLNRGQDTMKLNTYDAFSGKFLSTLFTETNPKYVEPEHGPFFINADPAQFLWLSRRDGYMHIYLYKANGELIRQLTSGPWEVGSISCSDPGGKLVFFTSNKGNPIGKVFCSLDLRKGTVQQITSSAGTHNTRPSKDCRYFLDTWSSPAMARMTELLDASGKRLRELISDANPLKNYRIGRMSLFTIKNDQNTELWCRLIRPADFDSSKRYPVIIYVYGGPHSQLITDSWLGGAGLFLNALAERGYVVFTLDNRGTGNRGREFEQAVFRNLGQAEVEDQMFGVRYLKSLPWVDSTRIGINGWSYGGFMTISMMLKNPGVFKVGVCGGPVTDWKFYEVMYGERYMDTPLSNPDGYKNSSLLGKVNKLHGRLLIIHDYQDETVVPQNSLSFIKKCVDEGKQVDYFIYPGHEHNVRGKDRVHLNEKMYQYFRENL